jgi:hypothetical protein
VHNDADYRIAFSGFAALKMGLSGAENMWSLVGPTSRLVVRDKPERRMID